jgi:hypothetical protein
VAPGPQESRPLSLIIGPERTAILPILPRGRTLSLLPPGDDADFSVGLGPAPSGAVKLFLLR